MIYRDFAQIYDRLMEDVPYEGWVKYLHGLFDRLGIRAKDILDLGCGTGNVTLPLAKMGYRLTGLDLSAEMLAVAEEKARTGGLSITWLQQDMREMDLGGRKFDIVISMTDSLNYIGKPEELKAVFRCVGRMVEPGGWFVFDLNSAYKIREVFGSNVFTYLGEDIAYVWENEYTPGNRTCRMELTFFVREGDGKYRRFSEQHAETGYETGEICRWLEEAGFQVKAVFEEGTYQEPGPSSERIYFAARRS